MASWGSFLGLGSIGLVVDIAWMGIFLLSKPEGIGNMCFTKHCCIHWEEMYSRHWAGHYVSTISKSEALLVEDEYFLYDMDTLGCLFVGRRLE